MHALNSKTLCGACPIQASSDGAFHKQKKSKKVVRRVGAHGPSIQLRSVKTAAGRQESAKVMQMLDFIKNNNANVSVSETADGSFLFNFDEEGEKMEAKDVTPVSVSVEDVAPASALTEDKEAAPVSAPVEDKAAAERVAVGIAAGSVADLRRERQLTENGAIANRRGKKIVSRALGWAAEKVTTAFKSEPREGKEG
eukprot:CAMPEP_0198218292 /NCGR_PEP_ID=MMETSP1445-20131203/68473_1 /TAXON_ID=36898 /ORGANISM="Pyramimonas sp., Strain CCMP2087" /LENGTH=196 /DNA_ID=CAMNT_0043895267 /DNA_START=97 /DNA_END=683 /DNA_ORIENTATION=+